jgi:hypothetical protein
MQLFKPSNELLIKAGKMGMIDQDVIDRIFGTNGKRKSLQIVNYEWQQLTELTGTNNKIMEPDKVRKVGIRSLNNAQLPKDRHMVVNRLRLLAKTLGAAPTEATIAAARYEGIAGFDQLQNGEITIRVNKKPIMSQISLSMFVNDQNHNYAQGEIALENPFLILGEEEIEVDLELHSPAAANTVVKLIMGGSITASY